jgi:hypothetical protein
VQRSQKNPVVRYNVSGPLSAILKRLKEQGKGEEEQGLRIKEIEDRK